MSKPSALSPEIVVPALTLAIGQVLRRLRAEANPDGLNFSQTATLALLEENGGMTTADLARAAAMKPQSMGTILTGLEQDGLVARKQHHTDGRQVLFSLTASGAEARRKRSVAKLDPADQQTLLSAAALIKRLGDASLPLA